MSARNHVNLIGNVGQSPKLVSTSTDMAVVSFSMATTSHFKNAKGEKQEKTEWHNIVCFGKVATLVNDHVKKGSFVACVGHLQTRQYQAKDETNRYVTEIVLEEIVFLDKLPTTATNPA